MVKKHPLAGILAWQMKSADRSSDHKTQGIRSSNDQFTARHIVLARSLLLKTVTWQGANQNPYSPSGKDALHTAHVISKIPPRTLALGAADRIPPPVLSAAHSFF